MNEFHKIYSKLKDIECNSSINKMRLFGIDAWPYLRIKFVNSMHKNSLAVKQKNSHLKRIAIKILQIPSVLLNFVILYISDFKSNDIIDDKRDAIFLTSSSSKRISTKTGWYDIYIDPIVDYFIENNLSYKVFETTQNMQLIYPRRTKTKILLLEMAIVYIKVILLYPFKKNSVKFDHSYEIYKSILSNNKINDYVVSKSTMRLEFLFIHMMSEVFEKKIKKINPQIAFVVSYYGFSGMAFCNACNRLGIKVVDIQHGVQGEYHPAYGSFFNLPINGYNVMPSIFFNWNELDKKNIDSWSKHIDSITSFNTGNLTLNKYKKDTLLSRYFDKIFFETYKSEKKKILITLQNSEFPSLYLDLIKKISSEYIFLIRMHPSSSKNDIISLKRLFKNYRFNNVEYTKASSLPLYCILRNTDLHITEYSSVVLEALNFKVKSIVTSEQAKHYYANLIENGNVVYCEDVDSIINSIYTFTSNSRGEKYIPNDEKILKEIFNSILS